MFISHINPVLFTIGNIQIRYYGIFFVIGLLFTFAFFLYASKKKNLGMGFFDAMELFLWCAIGLMAGARLFYALAYKSSYYLAYPMKIFALNEGGLSFHGGLIGACLGGFLYCLFYKKDFLLFADIVAIPAGFGIFLVKVANFTNSELVGRITNVPWAVNFNNEADAAGNIVYRHPSQLYEAAKNLVILGILWSLKDKNLKKGTLFSLFIIMYSSMRFFIEFFRQPDADIGFLALGLSMGQWLCLLMFAAGAGFLYYIYYMEEKTNN